jgi:hypothetical protein
MTQRAITTGSPSENIIQLCSANIEDTLYNLWVLNIHTRRRAKKGIPAVDLNEFSRIKAETIQAAHTTGHVRPVSYVDESSSFNPFPRSVTFTFDIFLELEDPHFFDYDPAFANTLALEVINEAQKLFDRQISNTELRNPIRCGEIVGDIRAFYRDKLDRLVNEAIRNRQPIPLDTIKDLLFEPDEYEERLLDPESSSLVGFLYESPSARFYFEVPFRFAEGFLSESVLRYLPYRVTTEFGERYSKEITEEEALSYSLTEIVSKLGNYYLDSLALAVFHKEVIRQSSFALTALEDLSQLIERPDLSEIEETRFWYSIHALLCSVANISKILWPAKSAGRVGAARGKILRDSLSIAGNSILEARSFRNHFEHWDERMDHWSTTLDSLQNRWIVDGEIGLEDGINSVDPAYTLRNFDKSKFAVTFRGEVYELIPVREAIIALRELAKAAFSKAPYCM